MNAYHMLIIIRSVVAHRVVVCGLLAWLVAGRCQACGASSTWRCLQVSATTYYVRTVMFSMLHTCTAAGVACNPTLCRVKATCLTLLHTSCCCLNSVAMRAVLCGAAAGPRQLELLRAAGLPHSRRYSCLDTHR
jgi:hypothetical protein